MSVALVLCLFKEKSNETSQIKQTNKCCANVPNNEARIVIEYIKSLKYVKNPYVVIYYNKRIVGLGLVAILGKVIISLNSKMKKIDQAKISSK